MIRLIRTDSKNPDFISLVRLLDQDLKIRDGEDHAFYDQFNKVDNINHVVLAYAEDVPIGCGAIKEYDAFVWEVKRMFVRPDKRGQGIASAVLQALEKWAQEIHCEKLVLETGMAQPEAIALYKKRAYHRIPNYGQYVGVENSVCMSKSL